MKGDELMRTFYIMVGIPGSGKTTEAKKLNAKRVSFDDIREKLYGDANAKGDNEEIQAEFRRQIWSLIDNTKDDVVVDFQGLDKKSRKHFLKVYGSHFDKKVAIYMETNLETCLTRNSQRDRFVPEFVIIRSHSQLKPPTYEEGFDEIIVHTTE